MDESQSKIIAWLRFPLMVGVVFIHAPVNLPAEVQGGMSRTAYLLFSDIIPRMAVPLFFLISGILFFYGMKPDRQTYQKKFSSRIRSLFIPYMLWNIILVALFFVISHFETSKSFIDIGKSFSKNDYYQVAAQMWFLRDLMLMVMLSPLIAAAIRYLKYYWLVGLFLLWYTGLWNLPWGTHLTESVFFFSCGAYMGLNRYNLDRLFPRKFFGGLLIAYIGLVGLDFYNTGTPYGIFIHRAGILVGCVVMIYLAKIWTGRSNYQTGIWAEAAFFVFTTHIVLLNLYNKALSPFAQSEASITAVYFLVIFLSVATSVVLYLFCRKYMRRATLVLMGGR